MIIIDFPQVILICHILDIWGFNAASQMVSWLIGTMLRGCSNIEAILKRSVVPLLFQSLSTNLNTHPVQSSKTIYSKSRLNSRTEEASDFGICWMCAHRTVTLQQGVVWDYLGFLIYSLLQTQTSCIDVCSGYVIEIKNVRVIFCVNQ